MTRHEWFAAIALKAIIAKIPLQDTRGEMGPHITQDELGELHKDIAASAYSYADAMENEAKKREA